MDFDAVSVLDFVVVSVLDFHLDVRASFSVADLIRQSVCW